MDNSHEEIAANPNSVVSPRGTEDGLILRIDGKADWEEIMRDVDAYLGKRRQFFSGGQVYLEWLDKLPGIDQLDRFEKHLHDEFGLSVGAKKKSFNERVHSSEEQTVGGHKGEQAESETRSPTGGLNEAIDVSRRRSAAPSTSSFLDKIPPKFLSGVRSEKRALVSGYRGKSMFAEEVFVDEDANAKIVFGPLRSGQRVETPFTLIVVGDVNPGCDLIAGGDIFVFGALRGTAHASAYDDEGYDRVIVALQMQPVQLRIGAVISRGGGDAGKGPEVARIDSRRIIVESFSAKNVQPKR